MTAAEPRPTFFATPAKWRQWLSKHHASKKELWVGFHKRGSGTPSITWPEAVDEALCFGWIDGLTKRIDERTYKIRFTPRKTTSVWSRVNIARVAALEAEGRMTAAGREAFAARKEARSGIYSFERPTPATLSRKDARALAANEEASNFFRAQPPWYRRAATHWVISAKREETRARRLAILIDCSAAGRAIPPLGRPTGKKKP